MPTSADWAQRQRLGGLDGTRPGAFLVAVALAVVLARIFAAVFEIPFLSPRTRPQSAGPHHPEPERVLA